VGNARRVRSELPGADQAFRTAWKLWQMGAATTSGLLNEARILDLEASLRRDQTRFKEALELLDRALSVDSGPLTKRMLLNKATVLEALGDFAGAVDTLRQAAPLVERENDPRSLLVLRFNLAVNFYFLDRYQEAADLLPELRSSILRLGNGLDTLRFRWLDGRIAAGLGQREEALMALAGVREGFATRGIAYDTALASLELAEIYLKEGRTAEVKTIARQMAPIFQSQGVHREALAALKLFQEAAAREALTLDLARRLVRYLQRAQYNPELRFEDL
jgi:tetratricopeptide (TPR) repeat protein